jgi:hypothetical protein
LKVPSAALRFRPHEDGAPMAAAAPGAQGNVRAVRDPQQQREQFEHFAEQLALDDDQRRKVQEISAEALKQARVQRQLAKGEATKSGAVRAEAKGMAGGEVGGPAAHGQMAALREQADQRIMAILRPDQQQKFHAMLVEQRENPSTPARVWVLESGKPKAIPISIGVADATHTELVRGVLTEGTEVIVGLNRQQKGSGSQSQRRFGF